MNVVAKLGEYAGHPGQGGQVRIRVLLQAIEVVPNFDIRRVERAHRIRVSLLKGGAEGVGKGVMRWVHGWTSGRVVTKGPCHTSASRIVRQGSGCHGRSGLWSTGGRARPKRSPGRGAGGGRG